jgi:hypothetical protein
VGTCPGGHIHYRYKRPTRTTACGKCSRRFDPQFAIEWVQRSVGRPAGQRPKVG